MCCRIWEVFNFFTILEEACGLYTIFQVQVSGDDLETRTSARYNRHVPPHEGAWPELVLEKQVRDSEKGFLPSALA